MRRRLSVLVLGVAAAAGCGGPPPGAPVGTPAATHGKITFPDGAPLKGGVVTFTPVEVQAGDKLRYEGAGLVDAKGLYRAGFNGGEAGLVPGDYKVTVKAREVGEVAGSNTKRIPAGYKNPDKTPLTVTIRDSDNTVDIVLK